MRISLFSLCKPLLAAGLALAASFASAAKPLKIGTVVWVGYGPFYVAEAKDFYKKHGVAAKLQFFSDPSLIPTAIASRALDGGMLTYDQVIGVVAKGMPQKVVMPIDFSNGGDAILATKDITRIADFKGKKIGFNPLSPSDFLLGYALQSNGLSEKDIQPVNMTPEAVPGAMASGQLPIGVTYEPSVSQILALNGGGKYHVVYSSKNAPGLIADVLVFDRDYIDKHPQEIKALIRGYLEGLAYMKSHPDESYAIIAKVLGVSPGEVKEQLGGVYNIPPAEMARTFAPGKDTTSFHVSGQVIGRILKNKGQIGAIPPIARTFDARFVQALE